MEFVRWDDDIPNMMGKIKFMFQTTNQLYYIYIYQLYRWVYKAAKKTGELPLQEQLRGRSRHWGSLPSLGWKCRANSYQQGQEKFESQGDRPIH